MSGIDAAQLHEHVIVPTLTAAGMGGDKAERLVLGTALAESDLTWIAQMAAGPARGLWQIEPRTARNLIGRYLERRADLLRRVNRALWPMEIIPGDWRRADDDAVGTVLAGSLALSCMVCRLKYWRRPHKMPGDLEGMAAYWKRHYNTEAGHGTIEHYIARWNTYAPEHLVEASRQKAARKAHPSLKDPGVRRLHDAITDGLS